MIKKRRQVVKKMSMRNVNKNREEGQKILDILKLDKAIAYGERGEKRDVRKEKKKKNSSSSSMSTISQQGRTPTKTSRGKT